MENEKIIHNFTYPEDVDKELIPLLNIINCIPGVRTIFSCCGHKREDFYLVLAYTSLQTRSLIDGVFKMKVFKALNISGALLDDNQFFSYIEKIAVEHNLKKFSLFRKKTPPPSRKQQLSRFTLPHYYRPEECSVTQRAIGF